MNKWTFSLRILHWSKRRCPDPIREVKEFDVIGFMPVHGHICQITAEFVDGEKVSLTAQVGKNPVTKRYTVNGIDTNGNQIAVSVD